MPTVLKLIASVHTAECRADRAAECADRCGVGEVEAQDASAATQRLDLAGDVACTALVRPVAEGDVRTGARGGDGDRAANAARSSADEDAHAGKRGCNA